MRRGARVVPILLAIRRLGVVGLCLAAWLSSCASSGTSLEKIWCFQEDPGIREPGVPTVSPLVPEGMGFDSRYLPDTNGAISARIWPDGRYRWQVILRSGPRYDDDDVRRTMAKIDNAFAEGFGDGPKSIERCPPVD